MDVCRVVSAVSAIAQYVKACRKMDYIVAPITAEGMQITISNDALQLRYGSLLTRI